MNIKCDLRLSAELKISPSSQFDIHELMSEFFRLLSAFPRRNFVENLLVCFLFFFLFVAAFHLVVIATAALEIKICSLLESFYEEVV